MSNQEMIDCPNHEGAYDCTPFCRICEGNQGYYPPLVGKKVTIICDEATLRELYKLNDYQWENFNESEFMFFIGDVEDAELNEEQMEFYRNNEGEN